MISRLGRSLGVVVQVVVRRPGNNRIISPEHFAIVLDIDIRGSLVHIALILDRHNPIAELNA